MQQKYTRMIYTLAVIKGKEDKFDMSMSEQAKEILMKLQGEKNIIIFDSQSEYQDMIKNIERNES